MKRYGAFAKHHHRGAEAESEIVSICRAAIRSVAGACVRLLLLEGQASYDSERTVRQARSALTRSSKNKPKRAELEAQAKALASHVNQMQREALDLMLTRVGDLGAAVQLVLRAPTGRRKALWEALVAQCDGNGRPTPLDLLRAASEPARVTGWEPPMGA